MSVETSVNALSKLAIHIALIQAEACVKQALGSAYGGHPNSYITSCSGTNLEMTNKTINLDTYSYRMTP